jgi:hypothetical protein
MLAGTKATSQHVPILIPYVRIGQQLQKREGGVESISTAVSSALQPMAVRLAVGQVPNGILIKHIQVSRWFVLHMQAT